MKRYEIKYKYDGKNFSVIENSNKGSEPPMKKDQFLQQVLNRIESLVKAGAVITDITSYRE